MLADDYLTLARRGRDDTTATEVEHRAVARFAFDAVSLLVAAALELDPAGFAGNPRAIRDALLARPAETTFLRAARRHWNSLWAAALRAERSLDDPITGLDAALSVAFAEAVFVARGPVGVG
jgi:hypothetical protein